MFSLLSLVIAGEGKDATIKELAALISLHVILSSIDRGITDRLPTIVSNHAVPLQSQAEGDDIKIIFCLFVRYLALLCLPWEKKM